jgi:hypothetical protein
MSILTLTPSCYYHRCIVPVRIVQYIAMYILTLMLIYYWYHLLPTVDVGAYTLLYAGVILQATVGNPALPELNSAANIINSMAAVLLWFNLLYYLRPYQSTGPLVMMILEIIADMRTFLVILAIVVVGFGNGEHTLHHYTL